MKTAGCGKIAAIALAVVVLTVAGGMTTGCGESKKEREAREAQEAAAAAQAREQMAQEQERMAQEQAARAQKAAAEQAVEQARTGWYNANPNANAFEISTAEQLLGLAQLVNGGNDFSGKTIKMTGDIDLSAYGKGSAFNDGKGWIPIGRIKERADNSWEGRLFRGTFDGGGKKIHRLYINDNTLDGAGLFGYTDDAILKNIGVVDVDITAKDVVGGIVGSSNGKCDNSYSTGTVRGNYFVGGVAGRVTGGAVANCYFTGTVSGGGVIGGVAGKIYSRFASVKSCYSTGTVSGNEDVGGVAGLVYAGQLTGSYSTSAISGNRNIGGIAGRTSEEEEDGEYGFGDGHISSPPTVTNNAALNPTVKGKSSVGRIVGKYDGTVSNNIAFAGLKDRGGRTDRWTVKGEDTSDGEDVTAEEIATDGTLGARFHGKPWITENGKLPVLRGKPANIPAHLR